MSALLRLPVGQVLTQPRPMLGIGLKIASVTVFVAMSTLLKAADGIPVGQLIFFRSFFAVVAVLLYLSVTRQLGGAFRTQEGLSHVWRGVIGVSAMSFSFFALTKLPLPEAIAINYASPLITVILGALFLSEVVRLYRWSAVLIGLVGVLVIIWPRLSVFSGGGVGQAEALGAIAALMGACLSAFAMMLVRRLIQTERTATIVIYFSITASVLGLCSLPLGWVMPTWPQLMMLISAGFAGGMGQILLTECYRHAPMSTIAPFEYTSMLLGIGLGIIIFDDLPTMQMLVGGVIVVITGIFIIYRERQLAIEPYKTNTPQGG